MRTEPKKGKEGPFKELKTFLEFSGFFPGVTKQTLLIRFLTNFHKKVSIHFFYSMSVPNQLSRKSFNLFFCYISVPFTSSSNQLSQKSFLFFYFASSSTFNVKCTFSSTLTKLYTVGTRKKNERIREIHPYI